MTKRSRKAAAYKAQLRSKGESYIGPEPTSTANQMFIEGTPCKIVKDGAMVDIGGKYDGFCPINEIGDATLDQRTLFMLTSNKAEEMPILSRTKAQTWEVVTPYIIERKTLFAEPVQLVYPKNGEVPKLLLRIAELPGYTIELPSWEVNGRLEHMISKTNPQLIPVVVKGIAPTRGPNGKVIVSNKKLQMENDDDQLKKIRVGRVVEGRVLKFMKASKSDQDSSAFVMLDGGAVALLHRQEVMGYPEKKLEQLFKIGDTISVAVTKRHKLAVTMLYSEVRSFLRDLRPGRTIEGRVLRVNNGAYSLEVGRGVYGRLYPEDMIVADGKTETLAVGSTVKVKVLQCIPNDLVLRLGRKQLQSRSNNTNQA
jgi:ribosomal protein S1